MTSIGRLHALTQPWWTWPQRAIRAALERARLHLWQPVVRQTLNKNAQAGRHPGNYRELHESIGRDRRNWERLCDGEYALTNQGALGLAVSLGLPVRTFFPEAAEWITRTVLVLCAGQLSEAEARAYVAYRLAGPAASNPHLDPAAVHCAFEQVRTVYNNAGALERAIERSADILGSVLEPLAGETIQ